MKKLTSLDIKQFLDSEFGPIKAKTIKLLADAVGINLQTIRAWRVGRCNPTFEQILIVSSAIDQHTHEGVREIAFRWLKFYGKVSKLKMVCLEILLREGCEYKRLSKANLLPVMRLLVQCGFDSLSARDIEFVLEMQEKIEFPITPEIITPLLNAKRQTAT